jgi:hypothetical protein
MKILFLFFILVTMSQAFLSKEWATKEMSCYRSCMIERSYDSFHLSNIAPYTCTCKVIKLARKECKYLNEKEYLEKFKQFKRYYINNKIKPMYARYKKFYPTSSKFGKQKIKLTPSKHIRNLVIEKI